MTHSKPIPTPKWLHGPPSEWPATFRIVVDLMIDAAERRLARQELEQLMAMQPVPEWVCADPRTWPSPYGWAYSTLACRKWDDIPPLKTTWDRLQAFISQHL